ncbi:hypothetical protein BpHYR1_001049 [Brachionus plicatilis]|uniref:Uncharacterized protein n=1 Tax=Brachionus plicatilis TaxID=10195 RepID=A0A3M7QE01_BRAPC|nr:hypothetical protein BpHYR1_001049 [Brachionus plicatilis]
MKRIYAEISTIAGLHCIIAFKRYEKLISSFTSWSLKLCYNKKIKRIICPYQAKFLQCATYNKHANLGLVSHFINCNIHRFLTIYKEVKNQVLFEEKK